MIAFSPGAKASAHAAVKNFIVDRATTYGQPSNFTVDEIVATVLCAVEQEVLDLRHQLRGLRAIIKEAR